MKKRQRLPAFESRDFRLWFIGQGISVIGTWLQNTGQSWLVLKLTNSPMKLGLLTAVQYLPSLLLSLFIGPLIDMIPKRTILLWTQSLFALSAAVLAIVSFSGNEQYWQIMLISLFSGLVTAVDWPTRQAFVSEQVQDRSAVTNAVALNNTVFNIARIIGPAIGGILIAAVGIPWTFALNAISYLAVIVSLIFMKSGRTAQKSKRGNFRTEVMEGMRYIRSNPALVSLLAIVCVISLFLLNFSITIPSFAKITLGLGSDGYGGLMSAMGVGALLAGVLMSLGGKKLEPKPSYVYVSGFILSIGMILVGLQRNPFLSGFLLAICGFGMSFFTTICNTSVQMLSSDEMRGRVMSVYNIVFVGVTPFGSLYSGKIADSLGGNWAFLLSGLIGLVFLLFMRFFVTSHTFKGITSFAWTAAQHEEALHDTDPAI
ncbi:MAG: MFS transporter [Spirochaetaceae bacterium]|nr:MFS transporter [Spirochaetaceae bacterium]